MEKFVNLTSSENEKAIKAGNNVPSGAVGVSLFSINDISPANNISLIDLSSTIPENSSLSFTSDNESLLAYADELGILHSLDGQYTFASDDISISNLFLNKPTATEKIDIENINPNEFVHYMYISRYFIPAPHVFSLMSLTQYVEVDKFKDLKIKVIDLDGADYVDKNTGRKKYRILLEPFKTDSNVNLLEIPYRVIVLLDASTPINLKLVYDKVESDESGNMYHLELGYRETINAVKFFEEQPEESFVIDDNYRNDKHFSLKKINKKYSELLYNKNVDNGYEIVSPSKGLDDYRTFEVFNWRLIARLNNSISLNEIPQANSDAIDTFNMSKMNVGVLYSSTLDVDSSLLNPYIFHNLENSTFNITGTQFVNKLSESDDKTSKDYWLVDLDTEDISLADFDVLAWNPTSSIPPVHVQKVKSFLEKNGTLLLDLSLFNGDITELDPQLRIADSTDAQYLSLNSSSVLVDKAKNGGWDLSSSIYEKPEYSIIGINTYAGSYKSYSYFDNYSSSNSIITAGTDSSSNNESLGVVIPFIPANANALVRGNIVAVTFPLMELCNSLYRVEDGDIITINNTNQFNAQSNPMVTSGMIEGPFKLLYNAISYAAYCRVEAAKVLNTTSTLYNYVSDWSSGWVMDKDALFEDEKQKYFKPIPGTSFYGLDIIPNSNVLSFYKKTFKDYLPAHLQDKFFGITDNDVEFFIEITNVDVRLTNCTLVNPSSFPVEENIPSAYTLYKVGTSTQTIFAYTEVASPKLSAPDNIGPYVIVDKPVSSSNSKLLNNNIALSQFKQYPFALNSRYTYSAGKDRPVTLDAQVDLSFKMIFKGTARRKTITYTTNEITSTQLVEVTSNCVNIKSAVDDGMLRSTSSSQPNNVFLYSGDIDIHKLTKTWGYFTGGATNTTVTTTIPTTTSTTTYETQTNPAGNAYIYTAGTFTGASSKTSLSNLFNIPISTIESFTNLKKSFQWIKQITSIDGKISLGSITYLITPVVATAVFGTSYSYRVFILSENLFTIKIPNSYYSSSGRTPVRVTVPYGSITSTVQSGTEEALNPIITSTATTTITTTATSSPHDYVKYIQYTVNSALNKAVTIDGIFGAKTKEAVIEFQKANNQRYLDGTVDSETKSYMAMFWKNLKQYYPGLYDQKKTAAPSGTLVYIQKIETIGLASDINTKIYKKLTFSGISGPNEGKDIISFEIPSDFKTINTIEITADDSPAWQNFSIESYIYGSVDDLFKGTYVSANKTPSSGKITINLAGLDATNVKYFWLSIVGKSIAGFGTAEGFSIKSIKVTGKKELTQVTPGEPVEDIDEYTEDIWGLVELSAQDLYSGISTATDILKLYSTDSYPVASAEDGSTLPLSINNDYDSTFINSKIMSLIIGDGYNSSGELQGSPLPSGEFINGEIAVGGIVPQVWTKQITISTNDTLSIRFNFLRKPEFIKVTGAVASSIISNGIEIPEQLLDISISGNTVTAATSITQYNQSGILLSEDTSLQSGFKLRTVDGVILQHEKNTISVNDGILLFCDSNGNPIGIPALNTEAIISQFATFDDEEIDVRYGIFSINNTFGNQDGFIYGFFDIQNQEFLGTKISYVELMQYGMENIFIAICAIDVDGNTQSKNEYLGPTTSISFKPVNLPLKIIAPIYSVKLLNKPSIRVSPINPNISKFDAWGLPVSSGSFWKSINLSKKRNWTGWEHNYVGQTLTAYYSTYDAVDTTWSEIHGTDCYDVVGESPKLIDDRTIQLRRIPLLNIRYQTDKLDSLVGIIRQDLKIYTRTSVEADWIEIPYSSIKDINSENGTIKFKSRIIPNNKLLIKVDYTVFDKNILLKQVDGNPIPLNPILNIAQIDFDEPLFIYLKPKAIYKFKADSSSVNSSLSNNVNISDSRELVEVTEYTGSNSVNFTYDKTIFDSRSSKFDPFALPIAIIYVNNNPYRQEPRLTDIRVKGGGVIIQKSNYELEQVIPDVLSHWDVYPALGHAYARGGYVIIRIPIEVKSHFQNEKEIYQIISNNLTAGVAYELQDMDGKSWN
jgi:peptidoglycan hydrolase-like protein with peptidoglycan-binding domain